MFEALRRHWPEYLIEMGLLGFFLLAAGLYAMLLQYPGSPVYGALPSPMLRRSLFGVLIGLTVVAIVYSPFGKQSGAHLNPAVTLTYFHLGKVKPWDAFFYILTHFIGGALGILAISALFGTAFTARPVRAIATQPGSPGIAIAFVTELAMSFILMLVVLKSTNTTKLHPLTGFLVGLLVAGYISVLAPLSGMSLNPARSFASALSARLFQSLWLYFLAPPLGMLLAAEVYRHLGKGHVICAKLAHFNNKRCIFRCGYPNSVKA